MKEAHWDRICVAVPEPLFGSCCHCASYGKGVRFGLLLAWEGSAFIFLACVCGAYLDGTPIALALAPIIVKTKSM